MEDADRARKRAWKLEQRESARNAFPLPPELVEALFAHVSARVSRSGCGHSLTATEEWIADKGVDRDVVVSWLEENGGYCDCEVVGNAADHFEQNR
jgi:hypothetical protein